VPKNEDGEFELVLGNKQLLSMFFVVVVLLGVFFVMGYIVGRNSAPLVSAEPIVGKKIESRPMVVDSPTPRPAPEVAPPAPSKPVETAVERPAETKPEPPRPPKPEPAPAPKPEPPPKREPAAKREPAEPPRAVTVNGQPSPGKTYLQLVATSKQDADAYVEVLRKNSFAALDAEVPEKPGTFRVLVGPVAPAEVNKVKEELKHKGIQADGAIRKTF
jgi:outer membrane biosynthesis protein TonB